MKKIILIAQLLTQIVIGQNGSVINDFDRTNIIETSDIDPMRFLPMAENNFWQYAFLNEIVSEDIVIKDSLHVDGKRSIYISRNGIIPPIPRYVIDTNAYVYDYHPAFEYSHLLYNLNARTGDEWCVYNFAGDTTTGIYRKVESIFSLNYLGSERIVKEIYEYQRDIIDSSYYDCLLSREYLASDLGIILTYTDDYVEPPIYLKAAIIEGDTLGTIVGIKEFSGQQYSMKKYTLSQNFPNPFNPTTTISYSIPSVIARSEATRQSTGLSVQLKVYDALGREIATLVNQKQAPGKYSVKFNGSNLPSGVYFYTLRVNNFVQSRKMILLR